MKPKNTVVLVIIAHIGLFLIWMCMGGCSLDRGHDAVDEIPPKEVKIPGPGTGEIEVPTTETVKEETVLSETDVSTKSRNTGTGVATAYDEGAETKYVVKSGDSLWKISRRFGVTEKELMERNDIQDPNMLREGRELYIPKKGTTTTFEPAVEKTSDDTAGFEEKVEEKTTVEDTSTESKTTKIDETIGTDPNSADESQFTTHVIVSGDTIWKLSRTYGVSTDDIMKANNITDATKIQIGQKLLIPKK